MRHGFPSQGSPIADARQIRALASPIRQDILDALTAIGPCSVAELAAVLGKPADGLYYHIRRLVAVGLVKEVSGASSIRGELRLDIAHKALYLEYQPASRANRAAVLRVIGAMVRSAERSFRRSFHPDVAVVKGKRRNLWAARTRGALTPAELLELNVLLDRANALMRSGRRRGRAVAPSERRLYELTFILAPTARSRRA